MTDTPTMTRGHIKAARGKFVLGYAWGGSVVHVWTFAGAAICGKNLAQRKRRGCEVGNRMCAKCAAHLLAAATSAHGAETTSTGDSR